jgi:predicted O-methyltransferase YrrM
MDDRQLAVLAELCKGSKVVVEVGCFQGKTTMFLAMVTEALIVAVDNFSDVDYEDHGNYHEKFIENMREMMESGRVQLIDCDSALAADVLAEVSADVIFLDGDHSFNGVSSDIQKYLPLVKKGGILCGHDYLPADLDVQGGIESVRQAVDAAFPCVEIRAGIWIHRC